MNYTNNKKDILTSIIFDKQSLGYISDSVIIRKHYLRNVLLFMFALTLIISCTVYVVKSVPVISKKYFDITLSGYAYGTGFIHSSADQFKYHSSKTCDYYVKVLSTSENSENVPKLMRIKNIECTALLGEKIKFIYEKDDPSEIFAVDRHSTTFSQVVFIFWILLVIITVMIFFIVYRTRRDYGMRFRQALESGIHLELQLQPAELFYHAVKNNYDSPLMLMSDMGTEKNISSSFRSWKRTFETRCNFQISQFNTAIIGLTYTCWPNIKLSLHPEPVIKYSREVCHIYGISENTLRKAANLPPVSDDMKTDDVQNSPASETDRMIFFAGPWISKNKTPDKKLNLYITTDEFRDYYTTQVK